MYSKFPKSLNNSYMEEVGKNKDSFQTRLSCQTYKFINQGFMAMWPGETLIEDENFSENKSQFLCLQIAPCTNYMRRNAVT